MQLEKKNGQPEVTGQDNGEGVSRRLSKRQQEKTPESPAQHAAQDDEIAMSQPGPAPEKIESRFKEIL